MNELSKQPVQPVHPADHTHAPGQGPGQRPDQDQGSKPPPDKAGNTAADQHESPQPDQKRGPSDTSHPPGQAGPSAAHPDVQHYMNLEKQGPNTPAQPVHGGTDAVPPQTTPPAPDHIHQSSDAGAGTTHGQLAQEGGAHRSEGHLPETSHAADAEHPADTKRSTETEHPADSHRSPAQAATHAPGTHERAPETRTNHEVHETPADRALRVHLQPFGITPDQARDYMRVALLPQLHLDPIKTMRPDDIQRAGNAVSHLPPEQLNHLTAQAKAADAGGPPTRQTIDMTHQPVVPPFRMEPPIDLTPPAIIPQAFQIPLISPEPQPKPSILRPDPKPAQPDDYAKKMADSAAQGHPAHRVPDVPDSERAKDAGPGDLVDAVEEAFGLPKLKLDFSHTSPSGPNDPGETKGTAGWEFEF